MPGFEAMPASHTRTRGRNRATNENFGTPGKRCGGQGQRHPCEAWHCYKEWILTR